MRRRCRFTPNPVMFLIVTSAVMRNKEDSLSFYRIGFLCTLKQINSKQIGNDMNELLHPPLTINLISWKLCQSSEMSQSADRWGGEGIKQAKKNQPNKQQNQPNNNPPTKYCLDYLEEIALVLTLNFGCHWMISNIISSYCECSCGVTFQELTDPSILRFTWLSCYNLQESVCLQVSPL